MKDKDSSKVLKATNKAKRFGTLVPCKTIIMLTHGSKQPMQSNIKLSVRSKLREESRDNRALLTYTYVFVVNSNRWRYCQMQA